VYSPFWPRNTPSFQGVSWGLGPVFHRFGPALTLRIPALHLVNNSPSIPQIETDELLVEDRRNRLAARHAVESPPATQEKSQQNGCG